MTFTLSFELFKEYNFGLEKFKTKHTHWNASNIYQKDSNN